ncbi:hydroxyethylthiazole kinase [Jeotgalibacillus haloalkalitolerans]|uniref:Hydroxyethylthiazole kinase n=1 Tax=Jeotgalibacillus haloalkalitolerans TaxID=3104292 RepID=A0ABU5KNT9_9BACL|nr:hydroxyethylthiazole kinase [Jeotgalibacillus sp. HH7-29]MDZ5712840.1 hydroxyethylthiazole kinase [Jeotgalibacillus sp. HH7-29]
MINQLREKNPLVHCITNYVVANFQANGMLALGASPVMGDEEKEVEELASVADALSLNIGTLHQRSVNSMILAGRAANKKGIPVVLDPVGAGATSYRLSVIDEILIEVKITALRCNAGELATIMRKDWSAKGVDAGEGEGDLTELAVEAAKKYGFIVAVTGPVDIVTDGQIVHEIHAGHAIMSSVTGMGCLLSSVTAAFLTVDQSTDAVAEAVQYYGEAGEKAARISDSPGSFKTAFIDAMFSLNESRLQKGGRR